ncbi:LuxR C-terminal-related transcriptional regulator [Pantoea ananatis]|uniref:LuxR C-terminal-related transcriptional regulator n=1 Tax=Pantoea ananas TaxID=553 RepID=UPI0019D3CC7D|nr:response regulator transcription factor [Pantoea ananatis]MDS7722090.1 response regulator transcription factor [Pantoea ananatis]
MADDHPLFREGMILTIERLLPESKIEQAGDLREVFDLVKYGDELDMLILDLRFPGLNSIGKIAELRTLFKRTTIIVVSMIDDIDTISEVMCCGADGFIGKNICPEEISDVILRIHQGEVVIRYIHDDTVLPLMETNNYKNLTCRQREVLSYLASGKTNKEIAKELNISPFTVRIHVSCILKILDVPTRAAAAAMFSTLTGK